MWKCVIVLCKIFCPIGTYINEKRPNIFWTKLENSDHGDIIYTQQPYVYPPTTVHTTTTYHQAYIYTTQHTSYTTTKNCDLRKHGVESACWIINGIKSYGYSKITAQSTAVTYRLVLLYDHDGWGLWNYMTFVPMHLL